MADTPVQDRDAFARIVKDRLRKAEQHTASLRTSNHGLLMASVVSSAATTLVAGGTAVAGPMLEPASMAGGWRASSPPPSRSFRP